MNWKTEATEKLKRYDAMQQAVKNIPEELTRLKALARGIRAADPGRTPVKGSGGRGEDMLLSNLVHRQELLLAWEDAKTWVNTTDRAMETLTPTERMILQKLIICPEKGGAEHLCTQLGVEQSSIYRRRESALRKFTMALYGAVDT